MKCKSQIILWINEMVKNVGVEYIGSYYFVSLSQSSMPSTAIWKELKLSWGPQTPARLLTDKIFMNYFNTLNKSSRIKTQLHFFFWKHYGAQETANYCT